MDSAQEGSRNTEAVTPAGPVPKQRRTLRKFTTEQRAQAVAESLVHGAIVREVAKRHGVRPNLLSYWRRQQGANGSATFNAVQVRDAAVAARTEPTNAGVIEIDLASHCVRVRGVVDGGMLREVLATLR